jgi:hypothetical protein
VIVNSNVITNLIKATDKAVPGPRDTDLEVPPLLLSVHESLLPINVLTVNNVPHNESFITEAHINKSNPDIAGSQTLATFKAGLWTVDLFYASNLLGVAGAYNSQAWAVFFVYQGYSIPFVMESSLSNTAYRTVSTSRRFRFLARDNFTMELAWDAPAVGERIATDISLIATKHL